LSEALHQDLVCEGIDRIGVTVAMPGLIRTSILSPERVSPEALHLDRRSRFENQTVRGVERMMAAGMDAAMTPEEVAQRVFDAAAAGELYVLPNHDSERDQGVGRLIGVGRATGVNPYPPILERIMASMARADGLGEEQ
ncbi:MAG TPA: hypothetical protein VF477_23755, partial [Mycobacterium sp.]